MKLVSRCLKQEANNERLWQKNVYFPWREMKPESRFPISLFNFSKWCSETERKEYDSYIMVMDFKGNYYMASSASGQYAANSVFWLATRAGKMKRYCPPGTARFVPANNISPNFKQVHESFLSPKLFSAKVKRFFVISLSLWNQKKRQREWNQRKQKCWWVLKIRYAAETGKYKILFWIWKFENLILKFEFEM